VIAMPGQVPVRYRSPDEDSGRWIGFPFRAGDIVISTRSKSGTTWVQMICALLIFQTTELPVPLAELSPWLDWVGASKHEVYDRLAAQTHRRFIKSHTPLDGLPLAAGVTYLVVARHPLDMAVSLYHQGSNLDRAAIARLTGAPPPAERARPTLREWLVEWIDWDGDRAQQMDSLPGVMWHLTDAWARRGPNVVLVHYDDLSADLAAQMRRLAELLDIAVPEQVWPALVKAASFESMRASAEQLAPDPGGVLKDATAFFRRGRSGEGQHLLSPEEVARYYDRTKTLAPPDMLAWLHRD
jgi:aryl sulfotransferase